MCRQIKLLTRLQLLGLFNLNEALHSRDSRRKKRAVLMVCMFILLGVMLAEIVGEITERIVRGRRRPQREFRGGEFVTEERRDDH